ncbi:MAG TPA: helix-turn-helix domain-containing protein [Gemmataceae bacterium]|nr:helix-turn-helix domain-containing protein [Gemmataceae bacterium]
MLAVLVERQTVRDFYTVEEFAKIVGRAEYTCREWCRQGRISAKKLSHGRGNEGEWRVSHEELLRYQKEGLLPLRRFG